MAVTKASASGLAGFKFKDASAGTTKIVDIPDAPTIGAAENSAAGASVAFQTISKGGAASTYTITSIPGGVTASGASSPIQINGLTPGVSYTFTVRGNNTTGTGGQSPASNAVVPVAIPTWQTSSIQTFNSTQNYVAAATVSDIAMVVFSGGGNGNAGSSGENTNNGGSGGAMGNAYSGTTAMPSYQAGGSTHILTIGAPGLGVTSVGNFLTSNGGGNASSKVAGNSQGGFGTGGNIQVGSGLFAVQNYQYGGSGGGGNWGVTNQSGGAGSPGSSPFGGHGGAGGSYFAGGGGGGGAANGPGGGGGGGGGSSYTSPGGGGAGATGRVIIIEKKAI